MPPKAKAAENKEVPKLDINIAYFEIKNRDIEFSCRITVNAACRVDIVLDYAKRQFMHKISKAIDTANLSTTDENKEQQSKVVSKLKEFHGLLNSTPIRNFVFLNHEGIVVSFAEEDFEKVATTILPLQSCFDLGVSKTKQIDEDVQVEHIFLHTGQSELDPAAAS